MTTLRSPESPSLVAMTYAPLTCQWRQRSSTSRLVQMKSRYAAFAFQHFDFHAMPRALESPSSVVMMYAPLTCLWRPRSSTSRLVQMRLRYASIKSPALYAMLCYSFMLSCLQNETYQDYIKVSTGVFNICCQHSCAGDLCRQKQQETGTKHVSSQDMQLTVLCCLLLMPQHLTYG